MQYKRTNRNWFKSLESNFSGLNFSLRKIKEIFNQKMMNIK